MKTGIHMESKVDSASVEILTNAVERVFESGYANHMDQETIRHALDKLPRAEISNTRISNCSLQG